jgi:6-hydroxycyclohex-1-ene-1-carbonyl-CoA dehydrogenase
VKLPARSLVPVPEALQGEDFESLAVVADAVSTAAQAVLRSGLQAGDVAFVVGAGGVGAFAVQVAKAKGASVVAFDVRGDRLALVKEHGVDVAIDVTGTSLRDVRGRAHQTARDARVPSYRWRIFECSGTRDGQLLAYGLLAQAATMVVVGYTRNPVELRLSNLMAFDATVHGSWGCPPEVYPEVLDLISGGEIALAPFIARAPMSRLPALLEDMAGNRLDRRMVLDPRV